MNVMRGGLGRAKARKMDGKRSFLTSNFNRSSMGFLSTSKVTSGSSKSLNNKIRYSFEGVLNTTAETSSYTNQVMGPPSAPSLVNKTVQKRNTSSTSYNGNSTFQSSGAAQFQENIGFLDLSQSRGMWTPKYRHSGSGQVTGSTSRVLVSGTRSKVTPGTSTSNGTNSESCIVLAISEGRGAARGEVGLAAIDLRRPSLTLCQLSDKHSYLHTLTALHFFNPVEIIVPNTFCDNKPTELYRVVKQSIPNVPLTAIQRRHFSDAQGLHNIKNLCAPEYASVELQLIHKFYALTAAAAVLKYVEYIQCVVFQANSLKVEYHCSKNSTWIDVETAIRLELVESLSGSYERGSSLLSILNQAHTAGGVRALRATILQPSCNLNIIKGRADAVQEVLDNNEGLLPGLQSVMRQLYDVDKILWLCMELPNQGGSRTGEAQLNHTILLKNTMDLVPVLIAALEPAQGKWFTIVKRDLENPKFVEISERIKRVIHDNVHVAHGKDAQQHRCFAVKPEINGLLDVARRSYTELVSDIQEKVEELSNLYNLPLRLCKNSARGFHIGISVGPKNKRTFNATDLPSVFIEVQNHGATVTTTTEEIVLLDQQANEALSEIQTMSNIVIFGLLTELRPYMSVLYKLCEHVAELDVIISLAQVSSVGYYVRPTFDEYIELKDSIHPMLDYVLPGAVVSNDVFASPEHNFIIITGPNMGGKTIYIKQIVLLQIMAQIGCYVPASSATFRLCDKIFTRIGFNDSIECNASTYIMEMKEIHHILQTITPKSLVILDELCRGTSSEEGTSMSWAICEQLLNSSAFTFFTTHFLYLTRLQDLYFNVVNLHVTADEVVTDKNVKQLIYKHKVMPGVTELENYGLILAGNTNLPETVVLLAKELAQVISSQKKPIPQRESRCKNDYDLYNLGAKLLMETRKSNNTDENIKQIIKEFKYTHSELISKLPDEQSDSINDSTKYNESTKTLRISKTSDEREIKCINSQEEDPLVSLKNNMKEILDKEKADAANIFNLMEDAQAIVKVSRNKSSTLEISSEVTETPLKKTTALECNENVIISDSDKTNDKDELFSDKEKSFNDKRGDKNKTMTTDYFMSQPSTSKGFQRNLFVPPFKKPQLFNFNQNMSPREYRKTDMKMKAFDKDTMIVSDNEDDEMMSNIDENELIDRRNKNIVDNMIVVGNNSDCYKNRARNTPSNKASVRPQAEVREPSISPRDSKIFHDAEDEDRITMDLANIFGSEQRTTVEAHRGDKIANTEDLENILKEILDSDDELMSVDSDYDASFRIF